MKQLLHIRSNVCQDVGVDVAVDMRRYSGLDALIEIVVCLGRYGSDSEPDGGGDMSGSLWKGGDSMGGSGLES